MPVFRAQINYHRGTNEKWSNVWHLSADALTTAADALENVGVPDLLPLLHNTCRLASLLVSDESTADFITRPIDTAGTSAFDDSMLPLFNSVKALFNDGSLGRPDYKFIKGFLTEAIQENGLIDSGGITAVEGSLSLFMQDMDDEGVPVVSADNDQYVTVSAQQAVQMRQMHRRRRRNVTP